MTGGQADSVFAAVPTYEFLWRSGPDGQASGINHDAAYRPRRQDREPHFRETGAFYVMSVAGFRDARHRFFGRTAVVPVPELTAVEIDHDHDLTLASALAAALDPRVRVDVDVVITDFDGVHTDDTAIVNEDGYESVRVSRSDGLGVERLRKAGVPILILSKETNRVVRARAAKLGRRGAARHRGEGRGGPRLAARGRGSTRRAPPTSATTSTIWVRWSWWAGRWRWPMPIRRSGERRGWC